jgi:hypothetical protein
MLFLHHGIATSSAMPHLFSHIHWRDARTALLVSRHSIYICQPFLPIWERPMLDQTNMGLAIIHVSRENQALSFSPILDARSSLRARFDETIPSFDSTDERALLISFPERVNSRWRQLIKNRKTRRSEQQPRTSACNEKTTAWPSGPI